ncbi:LPS export ABC transporter ATP-binding protein [candidate division WOR-3 bacterium]|uniref:Lipopolysaccharide export system ATP-binding protein LptB n=1 Tax=candidate division WOR-3 bacterium TaxID=2052148 RepID=A0A9D5K9H6_UNCW3|nr:LPS export ABC transporter ATP-binding protein [candidate division WOR-3 bacterium]MBD3364808.1 LPS export ABC transporter ATP-binding protein [candidate division WOR-3 bacterium]
MVKTKGIRKKKDTTKDPPPSTGWGSTLKTHNLRKVFGKRPVVRDVSVELRQGEVVGLLGPNGAGKTTTFSMIIGFLQPTKGKITIDDKQINDLPIFRRARMGIGYLSQEPSVFRKLNVEDNLRSILELRGVDKDTIKKRTEELLKKFEIIDLRKSKGGTLSGGERRRVEIARALATQPKFLLLDEPFTGIDPIVRGEIQKIIRLLKDDGIGILVTDHNVRETLEITDRAYLMYDSRIMVSGTPHQLVSNDRVREVYLGKEFKI